MQTVAGHHIIAELFFSDSRDLERIETLKPIFEKAVKESGLTKLNSRYHQFHPYGVTGFILLSESHIAFHTWPEKGYVSLDIYTCGDKEKGEKAFEIIKKFIKPSHVVHSELERGRKCLVIKQRKRL